MKTYKSHKTVRAAVIDDVYRNRDGSAVLVLLGDGTHTRELVTAEWMRRNVPDNVPGLLIGGYFVRYENGYTSWSPTKAFEEGYTEHSLDPKDGALPVAGYKPQSEEAVAAVNEFKQDEERLLRKLDAMQAATRKGLNDSGPNPYDGRWLAIGRTHLEQAFMAINRSVFQPGRVNLPSQA